jgi:parvulin-like peptidyl-prolyl isomerase
MSRLATILILICGAFSLAATCIDAQGKDYNDPSYFRSITVKELKLLLADVAKTNPKVLERLAADPQMREDQLKNLRELLAFASQAVKDGLVSDPTIKQELDNIKAEITAVNYDREVNEGKTPREPFAYIPAADVSAYLSDKSHDAEFERFMNAKIELLRASDPSLASRTITLEEREQARQIFAKTRVYLAEYTDKAKTGQLPAELVERIDLQVKLQLAQFLARQYSEKKVLGTRATDAEIAAYMTAHPELSPAPKRAFAQKILDRAKAGEDFAKLANEFSEDPGNDYNGVKQGGSYRDVPLGRMVKPFEAAALALEPGQIAPQLVESDFGFHIIKLDRKGDKDGETTYDVRHILISTSVSDPAEPGARPVPLNDYVRNEIQTQKERELLDRLVAANNISVPADFPVPTAVTKPAVGKTAPTKAPVKRRVKRKR